MSTYEREWFVYPEDAQELPESTRLHIGLTTIGGVPARFLLQLEYWEQDGWRQVARFDHDSSRPGYRDVERSGLYLDVYDRSGEQTMKLDRWPPESARRAMPRAERYLRRNAEYLTRRFESWR